MSKGDGIFFALMIIVLAGMGLWANYRITGLETRVNLLEARIHWQEEPPK